MDTLTREQRKYTMSKIKRRDTVVELSFRKYLRKKGYLNYRVDVKIPGRPDIYFPKKQIAIFIDGCFWHKCPECYVKPESNLSYWIPKIRKNFLRDEKNEKELRKRKIKVVRFWEHQIRENLDKCYNKFNKIYEKTN